MPRRSHSEARKLETAAMVREALSPKIRAGAAITDDDINRARHRLWYAGRRPIMATNAEFMSELSELMSSM